jgi:hypothetical protein
MEKADQVNSGPGSLLSLPKCVKNFSRFSTKLDEIFIRFIKDFVKFSRILV